MRYRSRLTLTSSSVGVLLLLLCVVGSSCRKAGPRDNVPDLSDQLRNARAALKQKDYERVESIVSLIPTSSPEWANAQLVAGEAATKSGKFEAALTYYLAAAETDFEDVVLAKFSAAEIYRELGQLASAEKLYLEVLEASPENGATHERLAFLLTTTGQSWRADPYLFFLIRSGSATFLELTLFADLGRPVDQQIYLQECSLKAPEDPLVQLGLAAHEFWDGKLADAQARLEVLVQNHPELLSAQTLLGEILVSGSEADFLAWHARLGRVEDHSDVWYVRGLWARHKGALEVAARCFARSIEIVPTHRRSCYQLGQVLNALNHELAKPVEQLALNMAEMTHQIDEVLRSEGRAEIAVRKTCELMAEMGRVWECCAWALYGREAFPNSEWHSRILSRYAPQLQADLPRVLPSAHLVSRLDLSRFPVFEDVLAHGEPSRRPVAARSRESLITFAVLPGGPDFVYFNSDDPTTAGVRMFESTGGGVAVLDFDLDGRPDLYLTQGAQWIHGEPLPRESPDLTDQLFRNTGQEFQSVTGDSQLSNRGYGQGCTVGDYNNDGFPDLFVTNYGKNCLFQNNGDGTFTDVSANAGLVGEGWSSSCAIVDLNQDGLPDLYEVNYLQGDQLYELLCDQHACSPKNFGGAPDKVYLNRGDGTFEYLSDATPQANGKGMGLIAIDLDSSGRPSLFVANDQVANFLLRNHPTTDSTALQLREEAFLAGVGLNEDGLAMACMGIAADDVDGNGLVDFFVTNFKNESNTLYLQDSAGLFTDATNVAGLRATSYDFVGWGTQFLDADRDGHPDLVLVNGHVDDYRAEGEEFHMRPQFLQNTGNGRFSERFTETLGPYFKEKYLGRGLARLDWNRDGLMDFAVSNINAPMSLVTNQTTHPGRFLGIRLHATQSARDAIGAQVTVTTDQRSWTKSLLTGDGYQASNERLLQFGLGDSTQITKLMIRWPSGKQEEFHNIPLDITLELFENMPYATLWRGDQCSDFPID